MSNISSDTLSEDVFFTPLEAAKYLAVTPAYLHSLRKKNKSPHYIQFTGSRGKIHYRKDWIDQWIESKKKE